KRALPWTGMACLAAALLFMATHMSANPPADKDVPPAKAEPPAAAKVLPKDAPKDLPKDPAPAGAGAVPGVKIAKSHVTAVTVYSNSALVTREVEIPEGVGMMELTVNPLPPTTINSSLYSEGTDGIRVLTTRFRSRPIQQDTREDVRKLQTE